MEVMQVSQVRSGGDGAGPSGPGAIATGQDASAPSSFAELIAHLQHAEGDPPGGQTPAGDPATGEAAPAPEATGDGEGTPDGEVECPPDAFASALGLIVVVPVPDTAAPNPEGDVQSSAALAAAGEASAAEASAAVGTAEAGADASSLGSTASYRVVPSPAAPSAEVVEEAAAVQRAGPAGAGASVAAYSGEAVAAEADGLDEAVGAERVSFVDAALVTEEALSAPVEGKGLPEGFEAAVLTRAASIKQAAASAATGEPAEAGMPTVAASNAAPADAVSTANPAVVSSAGSFDSALVAASEEAGLSAPAGAEGPTLDGLREFTLKSVRYLASNGQKTVIVRLQPESLGELRLDVTSSDGGLSVRIASANPAVREALESQMHGLRESLAESDLDATKVTVSIEMDGGGSATGQPRQSVLEFGEWGRGKPWQAVHYGEIEPELESDRAWVSPHAGTLDVLV
ncbi:MAG: flagellar hook-length control protein FliK [Candidatus Hydrogenedentes bacterium]|nr:flagellar hook-length control protein FliK [Candidatus Hydrogenedentota bacterium]